MSNNTFEIQPSPLIERGLHITQQAVESDLNSLQALAERMNFTLPEDPRVLLLGEKQSPLPPGVTIVYFDDTIYINKHTPTNDYKRDVVAHLDIPDLNKEHTFKEEDITRAIAHSMRLAQMTNKRRKISQAAKAVTGVSIISIPTAGIVLSALGAEVQALEPVFWPVLGSFILGTSTVAYLANSDPKITLPDVSDLPPPIRLHHN